MIRPPDIPLNARARNWLNQWQQQIDGKATYEEQVAEALRMWPQKNRGDNKTFAAVRDNLRTMSGDLERCWYCEDSCANEIEHIHPKSIFPHRAFQWDNYLYACGICNSEKRDHFALFHDAGHDFSDARTLLQTLGIAALMQPPLILNPRTDTPLDFLILNLDDFIISPFPLLDERNRIRARYTVEVLKLNDRSGLVAARKNAFDGFRARIVEYRHQKSEAAPIAELEALRVSLQRCAHRFVWEEMKRQATRRSDMETLFAGIPEVLAW